LFCPFRRDNPQVLYDVDRRQKPQIFQSNGFSRRKALCPEGDNRQVRRLFQFEQTGGKGASLFALRIP
jgi:hypothetical protein